MNRKTLLLSVLAITVVFINEGCIKSTKRIGEEKRVFYINSYHKGYSPSDSVMEGIDETLKKSPKNIKQEVFFMDTKRKFRKDEIQKTVRRALAHINAFQPDIIIASDDDAVKYIITPYFKNTKLPVVFCGVNWSSEQYGLPCSNITGMIEVLPIEKNLKIIKSYYPSAKTLSVISERSISEQKNTQILDTLYKRLGFKVNYHFASNFDEWKQAFLDENKKSDIIYLPTNGAIKNWNKADAEAFVGSTIKKPVITCDDFMMSYSVFGLTKVAKEQGVWAAKTALNILDGESPQNIPLAKNRQFESWINTSLAQKVRFIPKKSLFVKSRLIKN